MTSVHACEHVLTLLQPEMDQRLMHQTDYPLCETVRLELLGTHIAGTVQDIAPPKPQPASAHHSCASVTQEATPLARPTPDVTFPNP